jgi:hypothetical protein
MMMCLASVIRNGATAKRDSLMMAPGSSGETILLMILQGLPMEIGVDLSAAPCFRRSIELT